MKKNMFMRLAMALVLLVLVTTSAVGGTYAKYVSSNTASDSARVAKWGVVIKAGAFDMFDEKYETDDGSYTLSTESVIAHNGTDKLLAPGTKGTLVGYSFEGQPEVAIKVTYDADLTLTNWTVKDDNFYCPIVFTIGTTTISGTDFTNAANLEDAVENAIEFYSKSYIPNKLVSELNDEIKVDWKWDFETGSDASEKAANNLKDTWLGDLAAAGVNVPTMTLKVNVTVEQVD